MARADSPVFYDSDIDVEAIENVDPHQSPHLRALPPQGEYTIDPPERIEPLIYREFLLPGGKHDEVRQSLDYVIAEVRERGLTGPAPIVHHIDTKWRQRCAEGSFLKHTRTDDITWKCWSDRSGSDQRVCSFTST